MPAEKQWTVITYLVDGRAIDLTGLEPKVAIDKLKAAGVTRSAQIGRASCRERVYHPV